MDEAIFDEARRYAIALLAEGRDRLRDTHPSVPGALVAEVFWRIESRLPHLSRSELERLILGQDNTGAAWRRYTAVRQPSDPEARCWRGWPRTRQRMSQAQALRDQELIERGGCVPSGGMFEIQPLLPKESATDRCEEEASDEPSRPIFKGRVPLEFHCNDRLRLYREDPGQFDWVVIHEDADRVNSVADDQITGPMPLDIPCHLSGNPCLSHLDCPHRQIKYLSPKADGAPITFGRLLDVLYKSESLIADHNRQRGKHDEGLLTRLMNGQRAALWSQLRVLAAWEACHRVLRYQSENEGRLSVERDDIAREFAEIEQHHLRYFS